MNWDKLHLPYREDSAFSLLAFNVFLVPLVFSLFSFENFESIKFSLFLMFTGAAAALYFFRQKKGVLVFRFHKSFYLLLGAFLVWAAISAFLAQDRIYSFFGFYYRYTSGLVFYVVLVVLIYLLVNFLNKDKLIFLLKILVVDAWVVSVIAYLQSFGWIFYAGLEASGLFRGPSLLGNPNYSAMFLACILPFSFYFIYQAQSRRARTYYFISAFAIILGIFMLASRGAMLALAIAFCLALALMLIFRFSRRIFWTLFSATLVLGIFGYFLLNTSRPGAITSVASVGDINTFSRFYAWKISLAGVFQHPWFGSGLGNYALFFEHSPLRAGLGNFGVFDDAHNLFLQLAVTGGVPLALIFIGIILLVTFIGLKNLWRSQDLLDVALLSSLAAWSVAAAFNPVPVPMYLLLAVLFAGLLLKNLSELEVNLAFWGKSILTVLAAAIFMWGSVNLVSENLLGLARSAYQNQAYGQAGKLAGISAQLNPTNVLAFNYEAGSAVHLNQPAAQISRLMGKIQSLHPSQAQSYVTLSDLFGLLYQQNFKAAKLDLAARDLQLAINNMQLAVTIDPLFPARYGQLALYFYESGNYQQSLAYVNKDLAMAPGDFASWILSAKLYQQQGDQGQVIEALTKAFNLQPNIPELKYLLNVAKSTKNIKSVPIEVVTQSPEI